MIRQRELKLTEWDDHEEIPAPPKKQGPEDLLDFQFRSRGLPPFVRQLRFAAKAMGKQWRFDFAFPEYHLAVEIQGVVVRRIGGKMVTMGGHADVQGMRNDHAKHNAAILLGWSVLQFMPADIKPQRAVSTTIEVLTVRGWRP